MPLINWTDTMKVGIPSVDFEHETLVGEINALGNMLEANAERNMVENQLGAIHALIEAHFALEEKIMLDTGYNGYHAHKEDHDRLLEQIRDIMDDTVVADQVDITATLGARLDAWFSVHLTTFDRSFHSFIAPKGG